MKQGLIQEIAKFIKEYRMKKQWQMAATVMAVIVVFMTTYSLILPAITMTKDTGTPSSYVATSSNCATDSNYRGGSGGGNYSERAATDSDAMATDSNATPYYCGFEVHTHGRECYDAEGNLTCELTVHAHTEECLVEFTEEELALIQSVIDMIAELPTSEEAEAALAAFEEAGDKEGYEAYVKAIAETAWAAYDAYEALSEELKAKVTNIELLRDLEWLWSKTILFEYPSLEADDAYVSKLKVKSSKVLTDSEEELDPMLVQNSDSIEYQFSVETDCYSDMYYSEGRVRVEFVLPLATEQAEFDLTEMNWLDNSEGFEAEITTEERTVGGEEIECQILTGYKYFASEEASEEVIPGSFTGNVVVSVNEMEHNAEIAILISAAMEHNEWDGECTEHERKEKLTITTDEYKVYAPLSPEEQKVIYEAFLVEVEEAEMNGLWTEELRAAAEELLERVKEAFEKGEIDEEYYIELSERLEALLNTEFDLNTLAEPAFGDNLKKIIESGWLDEYSEYGVIDDVVKEEELCALPMMFTSRSRMMNASSAMNTEDDGEPSDCQIENWGGTNSNDSTNVSVSKMIDGTDIENVFDITLTVETNQKIEELYKDPDVAVVVVMDISNTMKADFGGTTRYNAAMEAAEEFIDKFDASISSEGTSRLGYVAFNTHAHDIFGGLQKVKGKKDILINTMRSKTFAIIDPDNCQGPANTCAYNSSRSKYTNIEAGLKMAKDMLAEAENENKYIIFLSDGFPTTYLKSGYTGYEPYSSSGTAGSNGVFYDSVINKYCLYGTSYSDKAAIRAREMATDVKNSGIKIFPIGVDIGGQTIKEYVDDSESRGLAGGFSVVDRIGTTYEMGDPASTSSFKTWLRTKIGSDVYYDSTNSTELEQAYDAIFAKIKTEIAEKSEAEWVAIDPMPEGTVGQSVYNTVEFIGFYPKGSTNVWEMEESGLSGSSVESGENTAQFDDIAKEISWDLKHSGYTSTQSNNVTKYTYQMVYRVRLKNERSEFVEDDRNDVTKTDIYPTNNPTQLTYKVIETVNGVDKISDDYTLDFPIPSVKGYLGELTFNKIDTFDRPVAGAEFTLAHDTVQCLICRGSQYSNQDNHVTISTVKATSDANGVVTFSKIPSGHKYTLVETKVPNGYAATTDVHTVEVAYDEVTVKVNGGEKAWNGDIVNHTSYELPQTGGPGIWFCTLSGLLLTVGAMIFGFIQRRRQERRAL